MQDKKKQNQSSLEYRQDHRTTQKFQEDIKKYTKNESVAAKLVCLNIKSLGNSVSYTNNGMNNSGKLITNHKNVNAEADFLFTINSRKYLYEIKVHPEKFSYMTLKHSNLITYLKTKARILIVRESGYYIFRPKAIEWILQEIPEKTYYKFAGNKPSHRLYKDNVDSLLQTRGLTYVKWHKKVLPELEKSKFIFKR